MFKSSLYYIIPLTLFLLVSNAAAITTDCSKLGRYECRHSTECTLTCPTSPSRPTICQGDYKCQPKLDRCEKGLTQDSLTKQTCEAQSGCKFQFPSCYCGCEEAREPAGKAANMPQCDCECGHGPPSHCLLR